MTDTDYNNRPRDPQTLTIRQVADILSVSEKTLETWRRTGRYKLPFTKIGTRTIRYLKSDVEQFLSEYRKEWPIN